MKKRLKHADTCSARARAQAYIIYKRVLFIIEKCLFNFKKIGGELYLDCSSRDLYA